MRFLIALALLIAAPLAHAASFPYVTLNAKTNRLSDNGTAFTRNGVPFGAGSALVFPSVQALSADTTSLTNAYVRSYFGTNDSYGIAQGGGWFYRDASSAAATNYGTVFASAAGGQWLRIVDNPSIVDLAWFGVVSSWWSGGSTFVDCTARIQNCIDTTPDNSKIIWPSMILASSGLVISNRNWLTIQAACELHGARNGLTGPMLTYCGTNGGTVVKIHNSGYITWDGVAVDTATPKSWPDITNIANVAIDVDKPNGAGNNTTDIIVRNVYLSSRSTNSNWRGLQISAVAAGNVENCLFENIHIQGGYQGGSWTLNSANGTGVWTGTQDNTFINTFRRLFWQNCNVGVHVGSGSSSYESCLSEYPVIDYEFDYWTGPLSIRNHRSETAKYGVKMRAGKGPVTVENSTWSDDPGIDPGVPIFYVDTLTAGGVPLLKVASCFLGVNNTNRVVFGVTNTVPTSILSSTLNSGGLLPQASFNFNAFTKWTSLLDYNTAAATVTNIASSTISF